MRLHRMAVWSASFLTVASLVLAPRVLAQEVVADYSWARGHLGECVNQLLGSHEDFVGSPFSNMAVATVRVLEDGCGERQVSVVAGIGDIVQVHIAQVIGEPILEQLFSLHEAAPDEQARRLCGKIPVDSALVEGSAAEVFRSSVDELHQEEFSLLPPSLAVVHGVTYSIWITSGQWELDVSFSDTRDPKTRHRIAAWAEGLLAAAHLTCSSKPHGEHPQ